MTMNGYLQLGYSAPEDGRKGRPKHVGHTCSCQ